MRQQASYHELCKLLFELCQEKRTGTLFITSDQNRAAHFTVVEGEIVFCSFGSKRGLQCLEQFRGIQGGSYSFSRQVFAVHDPKPIASTDLIFRELGFAKANPTLEPPLGQAARPHPPAPAPAAPKAAVSAPKTVGPAEDLEKTAVLPALPSGQEAKVGAILCEELAYYMGPAAPLVCESYMGQIHQAHDRQALSVLILSIARELPDLEQQQAFIEQVEGRLHEAKLF